MKKLDEITKQRLEDSRARLISFLMQDAPEVMILREIRLYVSLKYGVVRFAAGLLWDAFVTSLKINWWLMRYRKVESLNEAETLAEIARCERKLEKCGCAKHK